MKWMVLGGGGVFGVHLARWLLRNGFDVVSVGRNPWPTEPYTLGLRPGTEVYGSDFRYEQVHVLFEPDRLFRLMDREKPSVIVNFAALAYATSWEDSARYYETNVVALARMTEWLVGKPWLDRFVQIGTSELYGSTDAPASEASPLSPTSPYAVSKMAADLHLQTLKGFPAVILRPSNCYGEAQQLYRIVPRAAWCAATGERVPLQGGGIARKSYMHAEDLARAIYVVAREGAVGAVYNAGPDRSVAIREVVEAVARLTNVSADDLIMPAPARAHEDAVYWLNSDRLRGLGWKPVVDLDPGVGRVVHWVKEWLGALGKPQEFVLRA